VQDTVLNLLEAIYLGD